MKIPEGNDRLLQRIAGGKPREADPGGMEAFRRILESRMCGTAEKTANEMSDDARIRQIIEIIRLQMMLDEHLLGFMRGKDCLLYTSDAADDLLCVDLGGRRIIKKKKTKSNKQMSFS